MEDVHCRARPVAVQKDVVVDVRRIHVAQSAVRRKVRAPQQHRQQHARQEHARAHQRATDATRAQRQHALGDAQAHEQAEDRELDRRDHAGHQPADKKRSLAHRPRMLPIFLMGEHQRRHQIRQAEFLRAVPARERAANQHARAQQRGKRAGRPGAHAAQHHPAGQAERRGKGERLQHIDAQEAAVRHARRDHVQQIQRRALLLVDVAVDHAARFHHAADSQQAVRVAPDVDGVQRRALRAQQ